MSPASTIANDALGVTNGLSVIADCCDGPQMSQRDRAAVAVHGLVSELGLVAVLAAIRNGADAVCDVEEDHEQIDAIREFVRAISAAIVLVQP